MTQRIIYPIDDGGVAVIIPTEEALAIYGIDAIALKDVPAGVPYRIINDDEVPSDRTFRNAWKDDNGIQVDMPKAVVITQDRLRAERKPLLEAQDVLFQRALESGADTKAIILEKQRLRDITKITATTLDELKELSA